MTQEEKKLLIQDLSARLPYKVKIMFSSNGLSWDLEQTLEEISLCEDNDYVINGWGIHGIKPYLRPMSSMNEEEKREYASFIGGQKPFDSDFSAYPKEHRFVYEWDVANYVKWLNSHHFDFRGLIPMGLAIEAPKGMYEK